MSQLPDRPNFDQLRRQARELLRAATIGDPTAVDRIRAVSDRITLSAAQLAIARAYGYSSWSRLKTEVEQRQSIESQTVSVSMGREPETIMTERTRRVIVMAQEEARQLNHGFIGTEHLLLGLAKDTESISAQLLAEGGLSLDTLRRQVTEIIGRSGTMPGGSPPFTPRAKKVLELSLHEALDLGHQDISPEHILLGLIAEGEGVAAQILVRSKIDLEDLWRTVEERTGATPRQSKARGRIGPLARLSGRGPALLRGSLRSVSGRPQVEACSFCGRRPPASGRLVRGRGASICEHCISEWGERLAPGDNEPEEGPTTNG